MKMISRWIAPAAIAAIFGAVGGAKVAPGPLAGEDREHRTSLNAIVTFRDGATRIVTVEGVGCSSSMCSRVSLSGTWLDSISMIKDVTSHDALFVFKNSTERRLSVIPLNRVLYLKSHRGGYEKLDLTHVRSLEFASGRN